MSRMDLFALLKKDIFVTIKQHRRVEAETWFKGVELTRCLTLKCVVVRIPRYISSYAKTPSKAKEYKLLSIY